MTRTLCMEEISERVNSLECYTACRLIPLDKSPGVRPIGIGEVLRRIIGKSIMCLVKSDVIDAAGNLQLCAGQDSGCEAAVHAMKDIFEDEETDGVLLVDASNAFNSLNRRVLLHNLKIICPKLAIYVTNCYQTQARLFVTDGLEISSCEGTTQGDPTAMAIYALGIRPLLELLIIHEVKHAAYADDISAGGELARLKNWWQMLIEKGPLIGYYPEASKSWLIVKADKEELASEVFKSFNINITSEGRKHLGASIGSLKYKKRYVEDLVNTWVNELLSLSAIAEVQPQAAYSAFISGYRHKFNYYIRTIPGISELLQPIENVIRTKLIPSLCDRRACSDDERVLLSLPVKMGGLGLINVVETSKMEYEFSKLVTNELTKEIKHQNLMVTTSALTSKQIKSMVSRERNVFYLNKLKDVTTRLSQDEAKLNEIARSTVASSLLTTLPLKDHGFCLNKREFLDSISLRYGWSIKGLPLVCACGKQNSIEHALSCHVGGFVNIRHNELRDLMVTLLQEVCRDIRCEPPLIPLTTEATDFPRSAVTDAEARADISVRSFWQRGQRAFLDVRIFNPIAPSYRRQTMSSLFTFKKKRKKDLITDAS
ncbi:uncharacterized protein LOC130657880 [Hydractinia symbiolongicarpus]|uniref:uncharacterized protein LOC130657880 n=1 Tax=Hydractinia symbiolongicarpus TaxID=13093 RepID=UPI00254C73B8|nr:uncharacterized protein LOC130657880 [Hydractinia symbiolongicarpus]